MVQFRLALVQNTFGRCGQSWEISCCNYWNKLFKPTLWRANQVRSLVIGRDQNLSVLISALDFPDGSSVEIMLGAEAQNYLVVQACAPVPRLVDIAEQLAWLGEALAASVSPGTICYRRASCALESFGKSADDYTTFRVSQQVEANVSLHQGRCWESLFSSPSIAYDFPTGSRDYEEVGMEMTLDVMITLGEITSATSFDDKFMLKGFSSAFYPTRLPGSGSGSSAVWHFLCKEDASYLTCLEASTGCLDASIALDVSWLQSTRHFVGWTPESHYNMGKVSLIKYKRRAVF